MKVPDPVSIRDGVGSHLVISNYGERMLIVKIELLPGGDAARRRVIATLEISNISDLSDVSSYAVEAEESANPLAGTPARMASVRVDGHVRAQPVWALLHRAADALATADFVDI
jgi:hypothetical protein